MRNRNEIKIGYKVPIIYKIKLHNTFSIGSPERVESSKIEASHPYSVSNLECETSSHGN